MAITATNMQVLTSGAGAQGQIYSQGGVSGFQSKNVYGLSTLTLDGAATTATVNFIDGTQKFYQRNINIAATGVTAPATIGGVANQSIISGVGAFGALSVGQSVVVTGFANAGNNSTFTVNALTTSSIQVTNASAVLEVNAPSGNVQANLGAKVLAVRAARAVQNFAGVADTGASTIFPTGVATITDASCLVTISAVGTNAQTVSILLELIPSA